MSKSKYRALTPSPTREDFNELAGDIVIQQLRHFEDGILGKGWQALPLPSLAPCSEYLLSEVSVQGDSVFYMDLAGNTYHEDDVDNGILKAQLYGRMPLIQPQLNQIRSDFCTAMMAAQANGASSCTIDLEAPFELVMKRGASQEITAIEIVDQKLFFLNDKGKSYPFSKVQHRLAVYELLEIAAAIVQPLELSQGYSL